MTDVAEVRITKNNHFVGNLDIEAEGRVIASCNVDQSLWQTDAITLKCTITASDIKNFKTLNGNIKFVVVFFGGGTVKQLSYANKFEAGSNKISFNGESLTSTVTFSNTQVAAGKFRAKFRNTMGGSTVVYFLAPKNLCGSGSIKSGKFIFQIQTSNNAVSSLDTSRTGALLTGSLNDFNYPKSYSALPGASGVFSDSKTKYTVTFGALGHNQYL